MLGKEPNSDTCVLATSKICRIELDFCAFKQECFMNQFQFEDLMVRGLFAISYAQPTSGVYDIYVVLPLFPFNLNNLLLTIQPGLSLFSPMQSEEDRQ